MYCIIKCIHFKCNLFYSCISIKMKLKVIILIFTMLFKQTNSCLPAAVFINNVTINGCQNSVPTDSLIRLVKMTTMDIYSFKVLF